MYCHKFGWPRPSLRSRCECLAPLEAYETDQFSTEDLESGIVTGSIFVNCQAISMSGPALLIKKKEKSIKLRYSEMGRPEIDKMSKKKNLRPVFCRWVRKMGMKMMRKWNKATNFCCLWSLFNCLYAFITVSCSDNMVPL